MSKHDVDLLRRAKINRVVVVSDHELTLYADDHFFVIAAVNNGRGMGPVLDIRAFDNSPRLVADTGRAKPRPRADVINLAEYRDKQNDR